MFFRELSELDLSRFGLFLASSQPVLSSARRRELLREVRFSNGLLSAGLLALSGRHPWPGRRPPEGPSGGTVQHPLRTAGWRQNASSNSCAAPDAAASVRSSFAICTGWASLGSVCVSVSSVFLAPSVLGDLVRVRVCSVCTAGRVSLTSGAYAWSSPNHIRKTVPSCVDRIWCVSLGLRSTLRFVHS